MVIARRLRALATTALIWGGMYAVAGAVFNLLQTYWGAPTPGLSLTLEQTWWVAFRWAVIGAVSGGVFGAVFSWLERRRTFADLTLRRVVSWGCVGGMALPLLNSALILSGVVHEDVPVGTLIAHAAFGGMLGVACATAWFGLARNGVNSKIQRAVSQSCYAESSLPPEVARTQVQWESKGIRSSISRG